MDRFYAFLPSVWTNPEKPVLRGLFALLPVENRVESVDFSPECVMYIHLTVYIFALQILQSSEILPFCHRALKAADGLI